MSLGVSLSGICVSVERFGGFEFELYRYDKLSTISKLAFFGAKVVSDIPLMLVMPFMVMGPLWFIAHLTGSFWLYYLMLLDITYLIFGTGYVVSILLPDENYILICIV